MGEEYLSGLLGEVQVCGSGGKGLWHHHNSLWWRVIPCWEQEHLSQDPDCLVEESPLNYLATSDPLGPAKTDQVHDCEWPWEHLLPWEVSLTDTNVQWRLVLTIHWCKSRCSSTMYSSCYQQGSLLGANTYSPSTCDLPCPKSLGLWIPEGFWWRGSEDVSSAMSMHCMWWYLLACLPTLSTLLHIVEQILQ